jgi:glyoxylase-like metal-dependent hydrolase (beta-lactamase superfamily II)
MASYTGDVSPGGPPDVRELAALTIAKISVGPTDNNAYLLTCRETGESCLIDAAAEPERLGALFGEKPPGRIVTTHRHRDHWGALAAVATATGAVTAAGRDDAEAIGAPIDELFDDGDEVAVGRATLHVTTLVGHTPGSVALRYDDPAGHPHLFTGDSLFPGGVGNTHGDPDAFRSLFTDVTRKLFDQLPDDTWVYPGHGRDTTLGAERPHLAAWRERGW